MHLSYSRIILLSLLATFSPRQLSHITGASPITSRFYRSPALQQEFSALIIVSVLSKKVSHPVVTGLYFMLNVLDIGYDAGIQFIYILINENEFVNELY